MPDDRADIARQAVRNETCRRFHHHFLTEGGRSDGAILAPTLSGK
jgi:hypothetical protein